MQVQLVVCHPGLIIVSSQRNSRIINLLCGILNQWDWMSLINSSKWKFSHIFYDLQAIFLIFWPNKRCVTWAIFKFGPRFQFICPATELCWSEESRRPLREKEMQNQLRCQSSAETPTGVGPSLFMLRNSIKTEESDVAAHEKRFWYFWDQTLSFPSTYRWRCFCSFT